MIENETPTPIGESVSIKQASEIKGIPQRTLRNWISQGALPAYKVNGFLVRIRVADLDALFVPITGGAA